MSKLTTEQLLCGVRHGNEAAFREYEQLFGKELYGYFLAETRDPRDAEELCADVLRKAVSTWKPDGGRNLRSWLRFLARRAAADFHRKRFPYTEISFEELEEGSVPLPKELQVLPHDECDQSDDSKQLARIRESIHALPEHLKLTCVLQLRGYTDEQIASYFEVKPASVRVLRHRAIRALRKLLGV